MSDYILNLDQMTFFQEKALQAVLCSGLGGGKSFILQLSQILNEVIPYPLGKHCFAALSYRQLEDTSIPGFEAFFEEMRIPFDFKKQHKKFIVDGSTELLMRSQEGADKMRSVEIASLYCEELAYWDERNFKTFLGRLRDKNGSLRMRGATTPNGLNWFFRYMIEENEGSRVLHRTSSYANKHLPKAYLKMLESSYDSETRAQEIEGEFLSIGSTKTYFMFNKEKHVVEKGFNAERLTWVGMDFNVNPMTAVVGYLDGNGVFWVWDEVFLKRSNTYKMREHIMKNYGRDLLIIPDATGRAMKTSAVMSDHQILKEYFNVARVSNPHRKDRFNNVNRLLEQGKIRIHSRCKKLTRDLERFCDDGADTDLGHISDALGYVLWYYEPIKRFINHMKEQPRYL